MTGEIKPRNLVGKMEMIIVKHYNQITCGTVTSIDEIPDCAMQVYGVSTYKTLSIPLAMIELRSNKKPVELLMEQYCLTRRQVEYWAKEYGIPLPTQKV